jgi:hypothetical protein
MISAMTQAADNRLARMLVSPELFVFV